MERDRADALARQYQKQKPILEKAPQEDSIQVVNRKQEKEDIYIGRGSALGNPFEISQQQDRSSVINSNKHYLYLVVKGDTPKDSILLATEKTKSLSYRNKLANWLITILKQLIY